MKLRAAFVLPLLFLALLVVPAEAWFPHGSGASGAVVMQNVPDSFGNLTPSGRGSVRLSSQNLSLGTAFNPIGLGLLTPASAVPAKWTVTCTGGTCSHWTLPAAHTAEGSSAITPVPSSTGVTAHLNGGPYTFLVQAEDASNNVLASGTLTRTVVDDDGSGTHCGAVNIGSTDATFSNWPGGFAGTLTGCKVMMSTGYARATIPSYTAGFTNKVLWTWADTARPGFVPGAAWQGASANILLKDVDFTTGTTLSGLGVNSTITLNSSGTGTFDMDNVHAWYNATVEQTNAFWNFINVGGANLSGTISNFGCDYCYSGFGIANNFNYTNGYIRHPAGDVLTMQNACNFTMTDMLLLSPDGNSAVHPDFAQIKDGASICNYTVKRIMAVQGGGNLGTQGIYFGGGPNIFTGYIDDGSGTGTPGKVLTRSGGWQAQSNGSYIFSPGGGSVDLPGVIMHCPAGGPYNSNCNAFSTADISIASNISLGSPGSPVQFYGIPDQDGKWDMVVSTGFYQNGFIPTSMHGTGYYKHYAHVYQTTAGQTPQSAPLTLFGNCNVPDMWTGSYQFGPGMEYAGVTSRQALPSSAPCSPNVPPASVTTSNVLSAGNNVTTMASYYANGNPKNYLEALSTSQWDALSIAQVKAYVCKALTPTVSGPLDLGGGDWANPFNASGQWVDGTAVPGC